MFAIPWILISIGVLVILLGIIFIVSLKKGKKHEPDYYGFFVGGIIWIAFGIIFFKDMFFFLPMGIVFVVLGLVHKDKWKKNHRTWKQMNKSERRLKIIGFITLAIGIVILGVYYFWLKKGF